MKKNIKLIALIIGILSLSSVAYADTAIHLEIKNGSDSIYNKDVPVAPCDSEGDGVMKSTPYCALLQEGIPSDWSGLWTNSINGALNNDGGNGIYWMWLSNLNIDNSNPSNSYNLSAKQYELNPNDKILFYYNTNPLNISVDNLNPNVGDSIKITITKLGLDPSWNPFWDKAIGGKVIMGSDTFDLSADGTYSFVISNENAFTVKGQLTGFIDTPQVTITPKIAPQPIITSSGGGSYYAYVPPAPIIKTKFDIKKATDFLISQQKENGSFGEDLYTDWVALSLGTAEEYKNQKDKLTKYLTELKTTNYGLTDYERHSMALMAQGVNPYNVNGENYIKKIIAEFDGKQFGDKNLINDDIFALIVLQNAGFTISDKIISDDISFIVKNQKENGSWNESVDITGASIQALSPFSTTTEFSQRTVLWENLKKAREFLKQNQKETGGWNNVSSTAWAISGIIALDEKPEDWINNNKSPLDYLAKNQDTDGGIKDLSAQAGEYLQNKIWETAYTLSALSGKTWNQIMQKFEKPKEEIIIKNEPAKKVIKNIKIEKTTYKKVIKNIANQNTATALNALDNSNNTKNLKKSWFTKFFNRIFGF